MRRFAVVAAFALLGVGSVVRMTGPHALAQEATPAAQTGMEGVTYLPLGYIPAAAMPAAVDMKLARGTLEPGAGILFTADDPSGAMMGVEAGEITATVEDASWTISRGAAAVAIVTRAPAAAGAEVVNVIAPGETATFTAGEVAYIPGDSTGELHNSGDEQAVALLMTYRPTGS